MSGTSARRGADVRIHEAFDPTELEAVFGWHERLSDDQRCWLALIRAWGRLDVGALRPQDRSYLEEVLRRGR